nr:immunoglobulin light chain junction region [Macaca mulatta]MOW03569.1 immunoglobulin light chain junction region [Macaca mulatta]MOW03621.1 immunoglobulin light chain junction region [Macaca mulatta]MOW03756.1 immunoglobulin light chain junction region [Macaca mulatta]
DYYCCSYAGNYILLF